jgi:excisionase family DNA binding protein
MSARKPLYVRLPLDTAQKLDRFAFELGVSKQDLVADLVEQRLPQAASRRLVLESSEDTMTVGHHSFVPREPSDVLTLAEVAGLLRVDEAAVTGLAESGQLPGRKLGDEWRFTRDAVLRWLGGDNEEEES